MNNRSFAGNVLEDELEVVEKEFARLLRLRGFEPEQVENVPLSTDLAHLKARRDELEQLIQQKKEMGLEMNELERIGDQLRRSFEGGAWHGPSVMEVLKNVTAQDAAARPIPGAHSIWELTLHIAAWERAGLRRLGGDRAELPDEEDWAPVSETTEDMWQRVKTKLIEVHQELLRAIASVDQSRLDQEIVSGMSSVYITLHGVVQHNIYHAGQIALLKRALGTGASS